MTQTRMLMLAALVAGAVVLSGCKDQAAEDLAYLRKQKEIEVAQEKAGQEAAAKERARVAKIQAETLYVPPGYVPPAPKR